MLKATSFFHKRLAQIIQITVLFRQYLSFQNKGYANPQSIFKKWRYFWLSFPKQCIMTLKDFFDLLALNPSYLKTLKQGSVFEKSTSLNKLTVRSMHINPLL